MQGAAQKVCAKILPNILAHFVGPAGIEEGEWVKREWGKREWVD